MHNAPRRLPGKHYARAGAPQVSEASGLRSDISRILKKPWFDICIGIVIAANAVNIGIQQSLQINGNSTLVTDILESLFLLVYIVELGMRLIAHRWAALRDSWVRVDAFLVVLGVIGSWIVDPFVSGKAAQALAPVLVLRMLRLLRLAKTMRLFARVQECWMLVRGFMNSANILIYSFLMLFIMLYIFSCLAVELITKKRDTSYAALQDHIDRYFSTLPHSMLTLVRFACLDNTSEVYQPLVEQDPVLAFFFMCIVFTVSIVMFHLLGSVIFSTTLDQNASESDQEKIAKEDEWAKLIQDLKAMFTRLDEDKSGNLSKNEVMNIAPEDEKVLAQAMGLHSPLEVFIALDVDRSGEVSISEFCDGIWEIVIQKSDISLKRMEKQVERMHWRTRENFKTIHEMQIKIVQLIESVALLRTEVAPLTRQDSNSGGITSAGSSVLCRSTRVVSARRSRQTTPEVNVADVPATVQNLTTAVVKNVTANLKTMWEEAMSATVAQVTSVIEKGVADAVATVEAAERESRRKPAAATASKQASGKESDNRSSSPTMVNKPGRSESPVPKLNLQPLGTSPNGSIPPKPPSSSSTAKGSGAAEAKAPRRASSPLKAASAIAADGRPSPTAGAGASPEEVLGRGFGPPLAAEAKPIPPAPSANGRGAGLREATWQPLRGCNLRWL